MGISFILGGGCYLDNNRKEPKRRIKILLVGIITGLFILVGTSYAWWTSTATQTGINEVQSSCIKVAIQNETGDIKLQNAYPLTDKQAKDLTPYQFTITNTCKTIVDYTVKLEKLIPTDGQEKDLLNSDYIAVEFNGGQKELLSNYPTGEITYDGSDYTSQEARELIKGTLNGNDTKTYTIKLWMDESVTATEESMNKSFISKIVVDGSLNELAVYNEPKLHGADPVLGNEGSKEEVAMLSTNTLAEEPTTNDKLIPVIIGENGKVTRANLAHEWYNYEEKRWANAVILVDGIEEPEVGAIIPEEQIESYFVWIPKYKYKIFDMGKYTEVLPLNSELPDKGPNTAIEIIFGDKDTTNTGTTNGANECASPRVSGQDGQCAVGKWMTHPAFLAFGGNGLWVGKFETSNSDFSNIGSGVANHNTDSEAEKVIIKPNVYSWRYITVGNAFNTSLSYQPTLQSHMLKNTEWGAVAYLTNSIYGRCDKESNTCTEIRINNSQNYVTGVSAKSTPTTGCNEYNGYTTTTPGKDNDKSNVYPTSEEASTTKNNTGIFDMSGGANEFVAGYVSGSVGSSGLTEATNLSDANSKYFDKYLNTKDTEYNKRILGDATGEMGPFASVPPVQDYRESSWYKDQGRFVSSGVPWFMRGYAYTGGVNAGVFAFYLTAGPNNVNYGFRIALAPSKS